MSVPAGDNSLEIQEFIHPGICRAAHMRVLDGSNNSHTWFSVQEAHERVDGLDPKKFPVVQVGISTIPCAEGCCSITVYLRPQHTDTSVWLQVFVKQEYGTVTQLRGWQPKAILDAGGNIGLASVQFALLYPNATIITVEPDPSNFKMAQMNTQRFPNVKVVNAALWSEVKGMGLSHIGCQGGPTICGDWGVTVHEEERKQDAQLQATTVDALLRDNHLEAFDFIKVDIEGAEREVFNQDAAWISNAHFMMIETHDFTGTPTAASIHKRMSSERFVHWLDKAVDSNEFEVYIAPFLSSGTEENLA